MKKYITLAALLAAGTTFANAETVSASVILDFNGDPADGASLVNSVKGSQASVERTGYGYINYGAGSDGYNYPGEAESTYSLAVNGAASYGVKISNAISWNADFTISVAVRSNGDTNSWRNILMVGGSTNHLRIQSNAASGIGLYGNGSLSADSDKLNSVQNGGSISTEDFALLSLVYSVGTDGMGYVKLYVDGELKSYSQKGWTISNTVSTDVYLGKDAAGTALGVYCDELSIYNKALSADEIKTYLVDKSAPLVVPEPSAFGMLAGLGALALVASRRRRK